MEKGPQGEEMVFSLQRRGEHFEWRQKEAKVRARARARVGAYVLARAQVQVNTRDQPRSGIAMAAPDAGEAAIGQNNARL